MEARHLIWSLFDRIHSKEDGRSNERDGVERNSHYVLDDRFGLEPIERLGEELAELLTALARDALTLLLLLPRDLAALGDERIKAIEEKSLVKGVGEGVGENEVLEDEVDDLRQPRRSSAGGLYVE